MDKPIENMSIVEKIIADPDYIYSAEFVMKMANYKDNGDGTITFSRPNPYEREHNAN